MNGRWVKSNKIVNFPMENFDPSEFVVKRLNTTGSYDNCEASQFVRAVNVESAAADAQCLPGSVTTYSDKVSGFSYYNSPFAESLKLVYIIIIMYIAFVFSPVLDALCVCCQKPRMKACLLRFPRTLLILSKHYKPQRQLLFILF